MQSLQYRANDYTSSIWNRSSVKRAGSGCYTCRVSNIEQATITVVLGTCPAWSGPAVAVTRAESPIQSKRLYQ